MNNHCRSTEEIARCFRLATGARLVCKASCIPYEPSEFELREYCLTDKHERCPFLLSSAGQKQDRPMAVAITARGLKTQNER